MASATDIAAAGSARGVLRYGRWRIVAAVFGVLGFLLACLTPLLPVHERTTTLNWPQGGRVASVAAPLVSYVPVDLHFSVPCSVVKDVPQRGGLILSTLPPQGERPTLQGMFVRATADDVTVSDRDVPLISAKRSDLLLTPGCAITVDANPTNTVASFTGMSGPNTSKTVNDPNMRPQITGVYTELPAGTSTAGMSLTAKVDTRFNTSPTLIKRLAIIVGLLSTILSVVALGFLDLRDGRGAVRTMPRGWLKPRPVDLTVIGILLLWWWIGPNTSDDGYQFTMGGQAGHTGYMINYFRSFGVPENPFGWNDYIFTAIMHFTSAAPALRLPGLVMGLLSWLVISREMIPRLGRAVVRSQAGLWAGAAGFLLIWLPLNNGLRPEPAVVLFSLLTWVSIERSIATGRLLPVAIALPCAALTLGAAPGGLIAVAAILAASRQIITRIVKRRKRDGLVALVAPLLAAGASYLFYAFYTLTLGATREALSVKTVTGPTLEWYEEGVRYYYLMIDTVDGSVNRRIGVLVAFLCLLTVLTVMLRRRRPTGISAGPVWRLMAVFFATIIMLAFTPTKWTHHLGLYAGYAGGIAALAGTMTAWPLMRSKRNRVLFTAAVLFVMAVSFAGINGYYWAGIYGVSWGDRPVQLFGIQVYWVLFGISILVALYGLYLHFRRDYAPEPVHRGRVIPVLALLTLLVVAFDVVTVAKGAVNQRGSFSWAASNARALQGKTCGMADDVLMETDPDAGQLAPLALPGGRVPTAAATLAGENTGFTPNGVPASVHPVKSNPGHNTDNTNTDLVDTVTAGGGGTDATSQGGASSGAAGTDPNGVNSGSNGTSGSGGSGTSGSSSDDSSTGSSDEAGSAADKATGAAANAPFGAPITVNGSNVPLPFGLNPKTTPVLGSNGAVGPANLTTGWYSLPARTDRTPLVTLSVAGSVAATGLNKAQKPGRTLSLQAGRAAPDGHVTPLGSLKPIDAWDAPWWRNLRFPTASLPKGTNTVRVVIDDKTPSPNFVALTPPRMTSMRTAQEVFGRDTVVLADFMVAFAFPCQHQMRALGGVFETPEYRISPDFNATRQTSNTWQGWKTGGPLGFTDATMQEQVVPSYLRGNWYIDWGTITKLTPWMKTEPAQFQHGEATRSGWYTPGKMRSAPY
ncbi:arabinosyltransferase domain-containing protein [Tsukamurella sp. 8F]|uniref:arabinosyltransferase domain-containing protein n=1 Tax=unclassified Tsukamurella TaxID=2633480 RepID=UPI0023B9AB86|nr:MULTISPECIES: arabinosyltransferase domain-containing protein [unclassified Tsukamurella]MDF0531529.1 arabinosyltransferase domain-containing protein [Tsukamurella sp. 8J]MDF0588859.1 arabinosyltransferase domain-containing protein [Tsukamurella sp. 8F]